MGVQLVKRLVLTAVTVSCVVLTTVGAKAADLQRSNAAIVDDATSASQFSGEPVEDLVAETSFQESVNQILDPIIDRFEHIYAGAGFDTANSAYLAVIGAAPEDLRMSLKDYPEIDLIENAAMTAADADVLMQEVSDLVVRDMANAPGSIVSVDPIEGTTEISTPRDLSRATKENVVQALGAAPKDRSASDSTVLSPRVSFAVDSDLGARADSVAGGEKLTPLHSTATTCTAGFPARAGNQRGLLTAGHCPDMLSVDGGNKLFRATHQHTGSRGDSQWHSSKVPVLGKFRYQWGEFRPVWAHPRIKSGLRVCRFGSVSGNGTGCTTVFKVSVCIDYDNLGRYCKLATTDRWTGSKGGDSGGPWYWGNNAYGIHSGSGHYQGRYRNFFFPSNRALALSGLQAIYGR